MNVSDLYEELSYGELSSLAMAVDGTGTIQEEKRPQIIRFANDALVLLYTRFILKEKDLLIEQVEHITNYHLLPEFSECTADPEDGTNYPYIKDVPNEKFLGDVCKILTVHNEHGREMSLNDSEVTDSFFTPQANVLQVPRPRAGKPLSIVYQAFHPKLPSDDPEVEIELPLALHNAFRSYIAYKVFSAIGTQESTAKAQEHLGNYEAQCQLATDRDLVNTSVSTTNSRFEKRGWK